MRWESGKFECDGHHHYSKTAHEICNGVHSSQVKDIKSKAKSKKQKESTKQ